jgi:hypothetical protein
MPLTNLVERKYGGYRPENSTPIYKIKKALDLFPKYKTISEVSKHSEVSTAVIYKHVTLVNLIKERDDKGLRKLIAKKGYSEEFVKKCRKVASFYDDPIEIKRLGPDKKEIMEAYKRCGGNLAEMEKQLQCSKYFIIKIAEKENGKVLLRTKANNNYLKPLRAPGPLDNRNPLVYKYKTAPKLLSP